MQNKDLRYKRSATLCPSSARSICCLTLGNNAHHAPLVKWHHAPGSCVQAESWQGCRLGDKWQAEGGWKKSNLYYIPEPRPPVHHFNDLSTIPHLVTRFLDFLLNCSFTPVPTDQLNYGHFGKDCVYSVPTLTPISSSPWTLAEQINGMAILLPSCKPRRDSLSPQLVVWGWTAQPSWRAAWRCTKHLML